MIPVRIDALSHCQEDCAAARQYLRASQKLTRVGGQDLLALAPGRGTTKDSRGATWCREIGEPDSARVPGQVSWTDCWAQWGDSTAVERDALHRTVRVREECNGGPVRRKRRALC